MDVSRAVLLADALGCAVTAVGVATFPDLLRTADLPASTRWPIVSALALTAAACAVGARRPDPSRRSLHLAAAANAGWVLACGAAIRGRRTPVGRTLVVATGVLDAVMGVTQWSSARRTASRSMRGVPASGDVSG